MVDPAPVELIPVNVLTGFLGSGKTTLLRTLLDTPELSNTAVLVNEFGEVGLDHHLLEPVAESTLLLENGCLCCALRGDLQAALRTLYSRRERAEVPRFERVVIETSGLADPAPIAYTIATDPVLRHHFRVANVVTTVDALNGAHQLDTFSESVKQAAIADRLVLTKTDLCADENVEALRSRLRRLNPAATFIDAARERPDPKRVLVEDVYDAAVRGQELGRWLNGSDEVDVGGGSDAGCRERLHDHRGAAAVSSFCLEFRQALDWTAFGIWMSMLLNRHGDKVLRIKGMLDVAGLPGPVLINGVQHIVHPPTHLEVWPTRERCSRIVFILRDLERDQLETSLGAFNALAN